jgi:hypothetical protein
MAPAEHLQGPFHWRNGRDMSLHLRSFNPVSESRNIPCSRHYQSNADKNELSPGSYIERRKKQFLDFDKRLQTQVCGSL